MAVFVFRFNLENKNIANRDFWEEDILQCELVLPVYFVCEFKDTCTCTSEDGGGSAFGTCALTLRSLCNCCCHT